MTNATAHTPGRWSRDIPPARKYCIVFAGRNTHVASICSSPNQSDAEIEANCNLITAAPDLLAAVKALVDSDMATREDDRLEHAAILDQARAAIAKATGAKP